MIGAKAIGELVIGQVAVAEGAVAATQTHYRFRTDADAADATPTWGANEDVDYNPAVGVNFRLRLQVQNDSASALSGSNWQIRMSRNAAAYTQVTNLTTGVTSADASSDADETPIRIPRL